MEKNRLFGIFFIVLALLLILTQTGVIHEFSVILYGFSILLTLLGIKSLLKKNFYASFFLLATVYILLDRPLNLPRVSWFYLYLIALLMAVGFDLLFPKKYKKEYLNNGQKNYKEETTRSKVMAHQTIYVNEYDYESTNIEFVMSNIDVYFDQCKMKNNEGSIYIDAVMSTINVYVPNDWMVDLSFDNVLSQQVIIGTRHGETSTLHVLGNCVMSKINIIYL